MPASIALDATRPGPLSSHTFVVKDLVAIAGHRSSFGHPRWRETHEAATSTAPLVESLLAAGAAMVGLTKMDQLAYSLVGDVGEGDPPVNALDPDRFTGGSSSGSASAVAGGLADFGIGTDTAGSIRVPAAACGLFGIRPTHGAIDARGVIPLSQSFDAVGILARQASVLARAFDALDVLDGFEGLGALDGRRAAPRVPIETIRLPEDALALVEPWAAPIFRAAAERITAALGARLAPIAVAPFTDARLADTFFRLQGVEIWANHAEWIARHGESLAPDVRARLERCRRFAGATSEERRADEAARREYVARFEATVAPGEAILMPVIPGLAPLRTATPEERLDFRLRTVRLTLVASLCGAPQVVIPVRDARSGLTVGASLLGARDADGALLASVAAAAGDSPRLEV